MTVNSVYQAVSLSDHLLQVVDISNAQSVKPAQSVMYVRSYCNCDWDAMRECHCTAPWHVMDIFDDIDDKWHFFKPCLYYALNQYAPWKRALSKFLKTHTPWLTDNLLLVIKVKQHAQRRAARTHHRDDIAVYKKLKNKLKSSIHEAKLQYLRLLLEKSKSDPHDLWSGVNDIIERCKSPTSAKNADLSPDLLNNFFSTVAISDKHQPATYYTPPSYTKSCDSSFILH